MKNKILSLIFAGTLLLSQNAFAAKEEEKTEPVKAITKCLYEIPEEVDYSFKVIEVRKKVRYQPGELAKIEILILNDGNVPYFTDFSGCPSRPITRMGTARENDRKSVLYSLTYLGNVFKGVTGWEATNRIMIKNDRIDPGKTGTIEFWIKMPYKNGIYREYFDLVVEGTTWVGSDFAVNVEVGEFDAKERQYLAYIDYSRFVSPGTFTGGKIIEVDISAQRMYLKIGEHLLKEFMISTGTWRTPTPYGTTIISHKQEVRVGSKPPYYIMPKWMTFRRGGYGIHALPSIAYDNGYYWREALNHIGSRRSHGCIRLLPNDAEYAYVFGEVGTTVWVHE